MIEGGQQEVPMNMQELTPRQTEVLRMIADGQSSREIADFLCISVRTVEIHRANLMRRLGVNNVAQLIRQACMGHLLRWNAPTPS
jgi:DNA-binding CsgD family transcriptional regulator